MILFISLLMIQSLLLQQSKKKIKIHWKEGWEKSFLINGMRRSGLLYCLSDDCRNVLALTSVAAKNINILICHLFLQSYVCKMKLKIIQNVLIKLWSLYSKKFPWHDSELHIETISGAKEIIYPHINFFETWDFSRMEDNWYARV